MAGRITALAVGLALATAALAGADPVAAQEIQSEGIQHREIKRTELDRSPVSGDDTKEIVTQLVEFPPGSTSPRHVHNGEEAFYVIEGGTVRAPGKEPRDRAVGEHGINRRGVPHAGYTVVGERTIRILSVYVVDKGKPLQEPAP